MDSQTILDLLLMDPENLLTLHGDRRKKIGEWMTAWRNCFLRIDHLDVCGVTIQRSCCSRYSCCSNYGILQERFVQELLRRNCCFCIKTVMQNRSVLGQLRLWALALDLAPTLQVFSVGGFKNLKTKQKALSKLNLFSLDLTDIAKKIKDLFNEL